MPGVDLAAPISGRSFSTQGYAMYLENRPFTSQASLVRTSKLPDGSERTSQGGVERAYRDSAGRFRIEELRLRGKDLQVTKVMLFDPVALVYYTFNQDGDTAELTHVRPRNLPTREEERQAAAQRNRSEAYHKEHPGSADEELGSQVLAGEVVEGKRHAVTFPGMAGRAPVRLTTETWSAAYLEIPLLTITEDVARSVTTKRVTELQRLEPDPASFRLPDGMKVVEKRSLVPASSLLNHAKDGPAVAQPQRTR